MYHYLKKLPLSLYIILMTALLLHLLFILKNPGYAFNEVAEVKYGAVDADNYTMTAEKLLEKGVFGYVYLEPGLYPKTFPEKNAYITPGQPIYLAGVLLLSRILPISYYHLGITLNTLFDLGTIFLIYLIAITIFKNRLYGIIASGLFTTSLGMYHYFRTLLTEPQALFLFSLALYLFILAVKKNTKKLHIWFGIVTSILLMFRPNPAPILLIGVIIVLYKFGIKTSLKIASWWIIGPIMIIGPWVLRNWISLHQFVLFSTQGGNPLIAGIDPFNKKGLEQVGREMAEAGFTDSKQYAIYAIKNGFKHDFTYWFSWFTVGKTLELYKQPAETFSYYYYQFYPFIKSLHIFTMLSALLTSIFCLLQSQKYKIVMMLFAAFFIYTAFSNIFLAMDRYGYFISPIICLIASFGISSTILWIKQSFFRPIGTKHI